VVLNDVEQVHVSGHANEGELKLLLALTRPRFVVPVHGEFRHIARYKKLAEHGVARLGIFTLGAARFWNSRRGRALAARCLPGACWWTAWASAISAKRFCGTAATSPRRRGCRGVNVDEQSGEVWAAGCRRPRRGVGRGCRAVRGSGAQGVLAAVLDAEISGPDELESARAAIQSAVSA